MRIVSTELENNSGYSLPVQKIIEFVQEHYHERVTLERVSNTVYLSRSYISVLFKRETGTKFSDYLTDVRIRNARELLVHTSFPVQEVAARTGFFDTPHFSRVFKKKMGVSPLEYRKRNHPCDYRPGCRTEF